MASFNQVTLLGNLTRDIDVKYLQNGTAAATIGLAVNDRRKNAAGEWVEEPTFVDVVAWGRTAEIAGEFLSKGSPVLISGKLKLDTWEKDGQRHSKLKVVCDTLQLIGHKGDAPRGNQNATRNQQPEPQQQSASGDDADSIPF